jgi:malonate transporter and related proteins
MSTVLDTVVPVFGIILAGYVSAWFKLLPEGTARGLSDFTFGVAMPALLFRTIVMVSGTATPPVPLILAFFAADASVWVLSTLLAKYWLQRPALDWAAVGMGAAFGNTAMLGLPLGKAYFGDAAAAAIAVIIAVHSPILWVIGTVQHEVCRGTDRDRIWTRLSELLLDLAKNPIVAAVTVGTIWRLVGLGLPAIPDRFLALLGEAGIPGSLFALGLSLTRFEIRTDWRALILIVGLKLLVMPVIAYGLAAYVLHLPPIGVAAVVLLAACPTGANAFLFASRYERAVGPVAGAIGLGTALSAITIAIVLVVLGRPN